MNTGHLHLESGDIDKASDEALKAYSTGEQRQDHILMSRARSLQSAVELAQLDEQIGDEGSASKHSTMATQYSDEAIELAMHTQNKRLLAEAYIGRAQVAASDFFQEFEVAKEYASLASALLSALRARPAWPNSRPDRSRNRVARRCPRKAKCCVRCAWGSQGMNPPRAQALHLLSRTARWQVPRGYYARSIPAGGEPAAKSVCSGCRSCSFPASKRVNASSCCSDCNFARRSAWPKPISSLVKASTAADASSVKRRRDATVPGAFARISPQ